MDDDVAAARNPPMFRRWLQEEQIRNGRKRIPTIGMFHHRTTKTRNVIPGEAILTEFRKSYLSAVLTAFALVILLFPVISSADDFHLCHLSFQNLFHGSAQRTLIHSKPSAMEDTDKQVCLACLWSSFDTVDAANPVSLAPISTVFVACVPSEPSPVSSICVPSRAERAPPLA